MSHWNPFSSLSKHLWHDLMTSLPFLFIGIRWKYLHTINYIRYFSFNKHTKKYNKLLSKYFFLFLAQLTFFSEFIGLWYSHRNKLYEFFSNYSRCLLPWKSPWNLYFVMINGLRINETSIIQSQDTDVRKTDREEASREDIKKKTISSTLYLVLRFEMYRVRNTTNLYILFIFVVINFLLRDREKIEI